MRADAAPTLPDAPILATLTDRCVQCGLCLPHCPTYRLDGIESESPRGRIAYIKAVATGTITPTEAGDLHLDHCLGCRRCEAVCPAEVEVERLLVAARTEHSARRPRTLATRARLALLGRPQLFDGVLRLYRAAHAWLPDRLRPLPRPPTKLALPPLVGETTAALFLGCVATTYESGARAALVRLLAETGVGIATPPGQGCCGTAAAHVGDATQAQRLGRANRSAFKAGVPVLSLASGCQGRLEESLLGVAPVIDAIGYLEARAESLRFRSAGHRRVALHLPCSQKFLKTDASLRRLLARVPDLDLVELPDTGCCGAAGLHMLEEPARASRLREPVLVAVEAAQATEILSSNIGCRLHLANASRIPVRHPVEFLAEHLA